MHPLGLSWWPLRENLGFVVNGWRNEGKSSSWDTYLDDTFLREGCPYFEEISSSFCVMRQKVKENLTSQGYEKWKKEQFFDYLLYKDQKGDCRMYFMF